MRADPRPRMLAARGLKILAICMLVVGGLISIKALVNLDDMRFGLAIVIPGLALLLWGGILAEVK
jgi:hypothetical protein